MSFLKLLERLVNDSTVTKIEISAAPPFVKLTFEKAVIQAILQGRQEVSDVVAKCFIRRRVFWKDDGAEGWEAVRRSLGEVEIELNKTASEFARSTDLTTIGLAEFVRSWTTSVALVRKELDDQLRWIDDEKNADPGGYDTASYDRDQAVKKALISLRQQVYPSVSALINILKDDNPNKLEAQKKMEEGLQIIRDPSLIQKMQPDLNEITG